MNKFNQIKLYSYSEMLLNAKYWITTSNICCNAIAIALLLQFVIIIHNNIPRIFRERGQWFLANLKFKSELGDESFAWFNGPGHQAWHCCWLYPHLREWEWSAIITVPRRGPQLRFERHLSVHKLFQNMWGAQNWSRQRQKLQSV